jgi:hypothetical protein
VERTLLYPYEPIYIIYLEAPIKIIKKVYGVIVVHFEISPYFRHIRKEEESQFFCHIVDEIDRPIK